MARKRRRAQGWQGCIHWITVEDLGTAHEHTHASKNFANTRAKDGFDESNIEY
jgi:hypothetical protein